MRKFAQENGCEENWETVIVKPGGVLKKDVLKFLPQAIMDYIGAISEYCPRTQDHYEGINCG